MFSVRAALLVWIAAISRDAFADDGSYAQFAYTCTASNCSFTFQIPEKYVAFVDASVLDNETTSFEEEVHTLNDSVLAVVDDTLLHNLGESLESLNATSASMIVDAETQTKKVESLNATLRDYYYMAQVQLAQIDCFQKGDISSRVCGAATPTQITTTATPTHDVV